MRSEVVFCGRCQDFGEVPAEQYRGGVSEWCGFISCPDCPTCPCGMRFADHKDEINNEFLEPIDVVRAHGEAWAPTCLFDYEKEASHGHV